MKRVVIVILFIIVILPQRVDACRRKSINPKTYGIEQARSGVERYNILLRCHRDAIQKGLSIDYSGLDTIKLEIPQDAVTIPLARNTNFGGVVISVKNRVKNITLFWLRDYLEPCEVKTDISLYRKIWDGGTYLVSIKDANPWVNNRSGYNYGHTRYDLLYINKGKVQNEQIIAYNPNTSSPEYEIVKVDESPKIIKGLTVIREEGNTFITNVIQLRGQNNVFVENINIVTPISSMYGDAAFQIEYSANVSVNNLTINGTYSQIDKYGYGISMFNVWNVKFVGLNADGNWGVFGCNNVNKVELVNCNINRFDVHCYGKDITARNCYFHDLYNQFSSIYGTVVFEKCTFMNFTPVLMESSYNAYTAFDLFFKDCTFYLSKDKTAILDLSSVPSTMNERAELNRKCLPNITLKKCKVHITADVGEWYIVRTDGVNYRYVFDYISNIIIDDIRVYGGDENSLKTFSKTINTKDKVNIKMKLQSVK